MNFFLLIIVISMTACLKVQKKDQDDKIDEPPVSDVNIEVKKNIQEPVILRFNDYLALDKNTEIVADEIYLGPKAKILTQQFSLKIRTQKMFIDSGAVIQTFPENSMAYYEQPGLHGSITHIVAHEVEGNLQVFMNGQQGGPGKIGWDVIEVFSNRPVKCNPGHGADSGRSGSFFIEAVRAENFFITTRMQVAPPGNIGETMTDQYTMVVERKKDPSRFKAGNNDNCNVVPHVGSAGTVGQICMKLKENENPICEKF